MKFFNILILTFSFSLGALAQDTLFIYYDHNWKEISNKEVASFYRKAFTTADKHYMAYDYYIDGNIQMIGEYKDKKYKEKNGSFTYYFVNGKVSSKGECVKDKNQGLWTIFYENGQKDSEGIYEKGLLEGNWQYWFENGKPRTMINYKVSM